MKYGINLLILVCIMVQSSFAQMNTLPHGEGMAHSVLISLNNTSFYDTTKEAVRSYEQEVIYNGLTSLWKYTGNADYYSFIKTRIDNYVKEVGTIRAHNKGDYIFNDINNGSAMLMLYKVTGEQKYWQAAYLLYNQLQTHFRIGRGDFRNHKVYPGQIWPDLYMAEPFFAAYAELTHNDTAFNDIANQFVLIEKHARDKNTGLLYHGLYESKQQKLADKTTGNSPGFCPQAMGWYGMALVDAMEYFADSNLQKKELVNILQRYAAAIVKVQDKQTGLWWHVLNFPKRTGNYFESSASCMFIYILAKAVRLGYLPELYLTPAKKSFKSICDKFVSTDANGLASLKRSGPVDSSYRDSSYDYHIKKKVIANELNGAGVFLSMCSEMEILQTRQLGKGKTILLDGYFNHEVRKDAVTGDSVQYHYLWNEDDNNGFSMLKNIFTRYGVQTAFAPGGISTSALKQAHIYMIVDPDCIKENPRPNYLESGNIETIVSWVRNGGKLLLFGNDSGNAEFAHFNQLAKKFGIHFNENSRNKVNGLNFIDGTLAITSDNLIFKTVKQIYLKDISTLSLQKPAFPVLTEGKDTIIAVAKFGKGTVFAVGDPWLYNEYVDGRKLPADLENYKAGEVLVQWLLKQ